MNGIIDVKIDTDNGNISPDLVVGDIVISKAATGRDTHTYRAVVNKVTSDTITLVATTQIDCDKAKLWVRVGNVNDTDRQAYIVMDSEGSDAPKIAMYDNVDSVDKIGSVDTLKLILGNLDNISVPEFVSMSGYGLYAENVYLKGDMILGDNSSISFNSVTDGVSNVTTITKNTVTTEYINTLNITALGAVVAGTFSLGNGKFEVDNNGILTAEDGIFSGSITGSNITGSLFRTSETGKRIEISGSENNLKMYGSSGNQLLLIDDDAIYNSDDLEIGGITVLNPRILGSTILAEDGMRAMGSGIRQFGSTTSYHSGIFDLSVDISYEGSSELSINKRASSIYAKSQNTASVNKVPTPAIWSDGMSAMRRMYLEVLNPGPARYNLFQSSFNVLYLDRIAPEHLKNSDWLFLFQLSGSDSAINLPTGVENGTTYTIIVKSNSSTGLDLIIYASGGDVIYINNTSVSQKSIDGGERLVLVKCDSGWQSLNWIDL